MAPAQIAGRRGLLLPGKKDPHRHWKFSLLRALLVLELTGLWTKIDLKADVFNRSVWSEFK